MKYTRDSLLIIGYDLFYDDECAREISKIIEKYITTVISEERYKSINEKTKIWVKIYFRVNGDVNDVILSSHWAKWITEEEKLSIEKNIKQKNLNIDCPALKNVAYPKDKIIIWSLPIPCDW